MTAIINTDMPRITFAEAKKTVESMNLIDGFMFDSAIENEKDGEIVLGNILKSVTGRKVKVVKFASQKQLNPVDTAYHGIRLDTFIEENPEDQSISATVYNIEMENRPADKCELPRRIRYYQSICDGKLLESSADYSELPNFVSIVISSYDPFDAGDMYYEAKTVLTTNPGIEYKDGVHHIYLYCYGKPNLEVISEEFNQKHGKSLQEMLIYIVSGKKPAQKNDDIEAIDTIVMKVKSKKEVTTGYMQQWDRERSIKREVTKEVTKEVKTEDALIMIRMDRKYGIPEDAIRMRVLELGVQEKDIDGLFEQIDAEEKDAVGAR